VDSPQPLDQTNFNQRLILILNDGGGVIHMIVDGNSFYSIFLVKLMVKNDS
jgi:hypothetical protein